MFPTRPQYSYSGNLSSKYKFFWEKSLVLQYDLSNAFDTVDHHLLLQRLQSTGVLWRWFADYLSGGTWCVALNNCSSSSLEETMGVLQGSVLGPILFSICISNVGRELKQAKVHLHADDATCILQLLQWKMQLCIDSLSFNWVQASVIKLKFVLNANKIKTPKWCFLCLQPPQ